MVTSFHLQDIEDRVKSCGNKYGHRETEHDSWGWGVAPVDIADLSARPGGDPSDGERP